MRIDIRVHTDHITTDDLAVFAALAALTPGTPTPTTAVLNGALLRSGGDNSCPECGLHLRLTSSPLRRR